MNDIENDIREVSKILDNRQRQFDLAMDTSRKLVRIAAQSITLMHNGKKEDAQSKLIEASTLLGSLVKSEEFKYHTMQSMQEYAEAMIFFKIKFSRQLPSIEEIGVDGDAYIMGLMDVMGELKRELIGALSFGKIEDASFYYESMLKIFDSTREIRFAEAILPGFRRKQDVARIQLESASIEMLRARKD